jgi:hypothetical protein
MGTAEALHRRSARGIQIAARAVRECSGIDRVKIWAFEKFDAGRLDQRSARARAAEHDDIMGGATTFTMPSTTALPRGDPARFAKAWLAAQ